MPDLPRKTDAENDQTVQPSDALQPVLPHFAQESAAFLVPPDVLTWDDVHTFLVERIRALLAHNPSLLLSILYRIDVAEAQVKAVFKDEMPSEIPTRLADLIIERQLRKVRTRRRYSPASERSSASDSPLPER